MIKAKEHFSTMAPLEKIFLVLVYFIPNALALTGYHFIDNQNSER